MLVFLHVPMHAVCPRIIEIERVRRKGSVAMDPSPDYDASDEIEYFFNWLPWALRGVYPPPAYPPI